MPFKKIPDGQPIRLVFLGCGNVTARHAKTLRSFKNLKICFASRSEAKAAEYAGKFKGSGHFGSYAAAIESPETDVVFIATPPDSHLELALQAVRAGKHVIVEKPPFLRASDFDLIAAEREKTGVQVMVAENYFYKPVLRRLRQLLQTDVVGEPKFLFFNATKIQNTEDWRDEKNRAGGGALFEGGIHWVNFISNLGLEAEAVTGFQPKMKPGRQVERSMQVVVKYAGGAVGTLLYSWEVSALINGLRLSAIYGTEGGITFESNGIFIFVRGKKWRFILPGFADIGGFRSMFADFFKALQQGEEPAFNLALAKRDLEFIEAAYRTAAGS